MCVERAFRLLRAHDIVRVRVTGPSELVGFVDIPGTNSVRRVTPWPARWQEAVALYSGELLAPWLSKRLQRIANWSLGFAKVNSTRLVAATKTMGAPSQGLRLLRR